MDKAAYIQYLRDQAKALAWLADEIESGQAISSDWLIDWELHKKHSLLDAKEEYKAELEQAVGREVA